MKKALAMIVVVDFLAGVLLNQQAIISRMTIEKQPPHVQTFGQYAVLVTWPEDRHDDVDTYVRDPDGEVAWYGGEQTSILHLEHDDIGEDGSGYISQANFERVVLRAAAPGEYVANVQLYEHRSARPILVTVELWSLRGHDRRLLQERVVLGRAGDERTAFRFTLNPLGNLVGTNRLPTSLVQGR